jgi:hypothetical protein
LPDTFVPLSLARAVLFDHARRASRAFSPGKVAYVGSSFHKLVPQIEEATYGPKRNQLMERGTHLWSLFVTSHVKV